MKLNICSNNFVSFCTLLYLEVHRVEESNVRFYVNNGSLRLSEIVLLITILSLKSVFHISYFPRNFHCSQTETRVSFYL